MNGMQGADHTAPEERSYEEFVVGGDLVHHIRQQALDFCLHVRGQRQSIGTARDHRNIRLNQCHASGRECPGRRRGAAPPRRYAPPASGEPTHRRLLSTQRRFRSTRSARGTRVRGSRPPRAGIQRGMQFVSRTHQHLEAGFFLSRLQIANDGHSCQQRRLPGPPVPDKAPTGTSSPFSPFEASDPVHAPHALITASKVSALSIALRLMCRVPAKPSCGPSPRRHLDFLDADQVGDAPPVR